MKNRIYSTLTAAALVLASNYVVAQVKIGFVATLSGPGGAIGQDQYDGFLLALEQQGGKLGNQPVEVFKEDDQLRPDIGNQAVKKLIEKDKVSIITGMSFSNVLMATYKTIMDNGIFLISSNAGPSQIAGDQCSPLFFSTSWQNDEQHEAMGKYMTDNGYKRVYLLAPNYQAGKDALVGFKRFYKGQVVDEIYTQVNQPDYSAEIAQIAAAKPDATFVFYPGGMGVNFVKQYQQAGLLGKLPLLSGSTVDGTTLPALKSIAIGVSGAAPWTPALDNPENRKFVVDFEKKYHRTPSHYAAYGYDSARLLASALQKTNGKVGEKIAFEAALKAADFKSVRGNFKFNNNHFPIQNFYAFEIVKGSQGEPEFSMRKTVFTDHKDAYARECKMK